MRLWWTSMVVLAACTHEQSVSLRDLANGYLEVTVSDDQTSVTARLIDVSFRDCPVLAGRISVTLDGQPIELVSRGAYEASDTVGEASSCTDPTFRGAIAKEPTTTFAIDDGHTTLTATLVALVATRQWAVGAVERGTQAHFSWSVATDTVQSDGQVTPSPDLTWSPDQGSAFWLDDTTGDVSLHGAELDVAIPADATTGTGMFEFSPLFAPAVASCDGISLCVVIPPQPPALHATIAP